MDQICASSFHTLYLKTLNSRTSQVLHLPNSAPRHHHFTQPFHAPIHRRSHVSILGNILGTLSYLRHLHPSAHTELVPSGCGSKPGYLAWPTGGSSFTTWWTSTWLQVQLTTHSSWYIYTPDPNRRAGQNIWFAQPGDEHGDLQDALRGQDPPECAADHPRRLHLSGRPSTLDRGVPWGPEDDDAGRSSPFGHAWGDRWCECVSDSKMLDRVFGGIVHHTSQWCPKTIPKSPPKRFVRPVCSTSDHLFDPRRPPSPVWPEGSNSSGRPWTRTARIADRDDGGSEVPPKKRPWWHRMWWRCGEHAILRCRMWQVDRLGRRLGRLEVWDVWNDWPVPKARSVGRFLPPPFWGGWKTIPSEIGVRSSDSNPLIWIWLHGGSGEQMVQKMPGLRSCMVSNRMTGRACSPFDPDKTTQDFAQHMTPHLGGGHALEELPSRSMARYVHLGVLPLANQHSHSGWLEKVPRKEAAGFEARIRPNVPGSCAARIVFGRPKWRLSSTPKLSMWLE